MGGKHPYQGEGDPVDPGAGRGCRIDELSCEKWEREPQQVRCEQGQQGEDEPDPVGPEVP